MDFPCLPVSCSKHFFLLMFDVEGLVFVIFLLEIFIKFFCALRGFDFLKIERLSI